MRVWFDNVSKKDGRLLVEWWNANSSARYFLFPHPDIPKSRRRYQVVRQEPWKWEPF